jgi:hypothetical protein
LETILTTQIKWDYDEQGRPTNRRELERILIPRLDYLFRFIFPGIGRLQPLDATVWRTAHGWHLILLVSNEVASKDLILLQALLGSDFRREAMNWDRCTRMQGDSWNRLYNLKVDEVRIRRRRRFFRLRKFLVSRLCLNLDLYDFKETGRFKTVGRQIPDPKLSKEIRRIIRQAEREPAWN